MPYTSERYLMDRANQKVITKKTSVKTEAGCNMQECSPDVAAEDPYIMSFVAEIDGVIILSRY